MAKQESLPANPEAERILLGSILLDDAAFPQVVSKLGPGDFSLHKHQLIFRRMQDLSDRGERIDRVTLANELNRQGELEICDGIGYVASLDDGMPQIYNLEAYVRIVLGHANRRRLILSLQESIYMAMDQSVPNEEAISAATERLMALHGVNGSSGKVYTTQEIVESYPGGINLFLDPSQRPPGVQTGFTRFDELTSGLHAGDVYLLAARPGVGKTAWALNVADYVSVRNRIPVMFFSLEMSKESLVERLMLARARVDSQKFRLGACDGEDRQRIAAALYELNNAPLHYDDNRNLTIMDIRAKLLRLRTEEEQLGLVVIDYLQLISSRGKFENKNQEVTAISKGIKLLAGEFKVPILALSQLSRAVEQRKGDHRPQLSDLRESGSLEQDADLVGFLFREELYNHVREDLRGVAELIIGKQRHGPTDTVNLVFLGQFRRFENRYYEVPPSVPTEDAAPRKRGRKKGPLYDAKAAQSGE